MIEAALSQFVSMIMAGPKLSVAINLSANSLSDPDLWSFVHAEIAKSGIDPARLTFEITETAVINNYTASERFVSQTRGMGCGVSLDDSGTGVSSFAYLKRFEGDAIKIHCAFVRNMGENRYDRTTARAP